ncbi:MAG: DUF456 domain-containing protein [Chloroflexota bacterium]
MSTFVEIVSVAAALLFMLVGLLGIVLPILPGLGLVWIGLLIYVAVNGFELIAPWQFALLTVLALAGLTAEIWLSQIGARVGGADRRSLWIGLAGGMLGGLIFLFAGGIGVGIGAVLGAVIGVFASEYKLKGSGNAAWRSGAGWLVGLLASVFVQLILGLVILVVFLVLLFQ